MVDIHCHILPDFDDGAADLDEALAMARLSAASGVTDIIATPHFRGEEDSLPRLQTLLQRHQLLQTAIRRAQIPVNLHPGCEILCLPQTPRLAKADALPTLGSGNYLLCEFYFDASGLYISDMLRTLTDCGYRVVVAHPERYHTVQRTPELARSWFRQGYVLQMNKGSILGAFGGRVQQTAAWLLDRGLYHLAASDAHSPDHRTTDLRSLERYLLERCSEEYVDILLREHPRRILLGQDMLPVE